MMARRTHSDQCQELTMGGHVHPGWRDSVMQPLIERTAPVAGQSRNATAGAQPGAVGGGLSTACWWWSCAAAIACLVLRLANILTLPVFTDESTWVRSGQFAALGPPHGRLYSMAGSSQHWSARVPASW